MAENQENMKIKIDGGVPSTKFAKRRKYRKWKPSRRDIKVALGEKEAMNEALQAMIRNLEGENRCLTNTLAEKKGEIIQLKEQLEDLQKELDGKTEAADVNNILHQGEVSGLTRALQVTITKLLEVQ